MFSLISEQCKNTSTHETHVASYITETTKNHDSKHNSKRLERQNKHIVHRPTQQTST